MLQKAVMIKCISEGFIFTQQLYKHIILIIYTYSEHATEQNQATCICICSAYTAYETALRCASTSFLHTSLRFRGFVK